MSTTTQEHESENTKELVRALNKCIETCTDAEKGYGAAAADVRAPDLKSAFLDYAQQRGAFVLALQRAIQKLGASPENEGTLRGSLHRGWMTARRIVEGRNDHAIVESCVFGEQTTLHAYEAADRAVHHPVPEEIRVLVREQYAAIQRAHADLQARLAPG